MSFRCIESCPYRNLTVRFFICCHFVLPRFCLSVIGALWTPRSCRWPCQMGSLARTNWELPFWNTRTPVSIICKQCFWKEALLENFFNFFFLFWLTSSVFEMYWVFSILFHFGIWLFDLPFVVIYVLFRFLLLVIGLLGPMEVTFLLWILSGGLNSARVLTASNLKLEDCFCQHLQAWFMESNVVRQFGILF